jgi:acetolactate synthase small subunit
MEPNDIRIAQTNRRVPIGTLALGIVIGFLLLAVMAHLARSGVLNRFAGFMTGRGTRIDTSSPAVVAKIRQLSRLETVVYSLDKIVEGEKQSAFLPSFLVGDKILLVAHGEVTAGVDLSQLQLGDVSVHGDSVHVKLPATQILSTRIDNARTQVYSRVTGLLVNTDPNLESQVRMAAEQQITQAALDDGILEKAHQNARTSITALLYGLGFKTVQVE